MPYTREELDWIENEWSHNLYGRPAFISREDYQQLQTWSDAGVPASDVINAIKVYFQRRAKNSKGRSFVALSYLANDVAKALKLSSTINLTDVLAENSLWNKVKEPMRSDLRGRLLFVTWKRLQISAPSNDSPAFLTYFNDEQKALKELVDYAESQLGDKVEQLQIELRTKLVESNFIEGTISWRRAWEHSWMRIVCDFWHIPW